MNKKDLPAYRHHICETYNARSSKYDWQRNTALKLIDWEPAKTGDSVLDIGTGTGTIAFRAASPMLESELQCRDSAKLWHTRQLSLRQAGRQKTNGTQLAQ